MPDNTETVVSTDMSASAIAAEALAQRNGEVRKELIKKQKVILKRKGQLAAHVAAFDKKVAEFEKAITDAANPEQIMAVLATYKFPANSIHFAPSQDD